MFGKTACEQRKTDFKFMLTTRSHSSALVSTTFLRSAPPATLTRMSILPQRSRAALTISWTDFLLVTSVTSEIASVPRSAISFTRALAASASMSATASLAPSPAKRCTIAPPIPPPPPVTMATLLSMAPIRVPPGSFRLARKIIEHFRQVLDALHFGVLEALVVGPMRHHDDGLGLGRDVLAVFMAVVDEKLDFELPDEL